MGVSRGRKRSWGKCARGENTKRKNINSSFTVVKGRGAAKLGQAGIKGGRKKRGKTERTLLRERGGV